MCVKRVVAVQEVQWAWVKVRMCVGVGREDGGAWVVGGVVVGVVFGGVRRYGSVCGVGSGGMGLLRGVSLRDGILDFVGRRGVRRVVLHLCCRELGRVGEGACVFLS